MRWSNAKIFCEMNRITCPYSNLKVQNITMAYFMTPLYNKITALCLLWNIGRIKNVVGLVRLLMALT